MTNKIKSLRALRTRKSYEKPNCPVCKVQMKRKGKKGKDEYFKCPKCKGKVRQDGVFIAPPNPETLDLRNQQIREYKKEIALRKLVVKLKKQKYLGYKSFEWEGRIINLDDYDFDGITFEEKQRMAEEEKKKKEAEKKQKKKKAKETVKGDKE